MNTGEAIGIMAKEKGFNLRQLAAKAEVPYNTLYAIVKRKSSRIDGKTLRRVADALGVSIDEIEPFTPNVMRLDEGERLVTGPRFESVVTTRMIDADNLESRRAAKEDVTQLLEAFDALDGDGQKKAIEFVSILAKVPDYRIQAAGERRPSASVENRVAAERIQMRKAEREAKLYRLMESFLSAHDAGDIELESARVTELLDTYSPKKTPGQKRSTEEYEILLRIVSAHDEGREDDEHMLIVELVDAAVNGAEASDKPQSDLNQ
ncbi:MAG: helix-turn-helix transcriptional regulator [Oscillospiraceae bacterium]|nr:helix-turn-helix transcriptional regulator [Oscillospiraceae bacterium]